MGRRRSPNGQSEGNPDVGDSGQSQGSAAGGAPGAAHPDAAWPTARQSLGRRGRALRAGLCPTHKRIARRFVGVTADGWAFSCVDGPHVFVVPADPAAPKTPYEAAAAAAWAVANRRR